MKFRKILLKYESEKIPDHQNGIYFISLRMPSKFELGFSKSTPDLKPIKNLLLSKIDLISSFSSNQYLNGHLITYNRASHLRTLFDIRGETSSKPSSIVKQILKVKSIEEFEILLFILDTIVNSIQPLYVGKTVEQSLKTRYEQHVISNSYISSFLSENKLDWNDLSFSYLEGEYFLDGENIGLYEKLMQNMFKPIICQK